MVLALREGANASSSHSAGERARSRVEAAREDVAQLIGGLPEQILFTSGGTEANNTVLLALRNGQVPKRLITTTVEHPSVLAAGDVLRTSGVDVVEIEVSRKG